MNKIKRIFLKKNDRKKTQSMLTFEIDKFGNKPDTNLI